MEKTNFYVEKINEKFNTRFVCDQDINWDYISSMVEVPADLLAYSNYLNWDIVSMSGKIWWILSFYERGIERGGINYLNYFKDKINWDLFFKYTNAPLWDVIEVDPSFFEKYVNWDIVFKYQKYICGYDWSQEELIEIAGEKANWSIISRYQNMTDEFIIKYIKKLDLDLVLKYQILSTDVISELKSLGLIGENEINIILQNQPFFGISDKEISGLLEIEESEVVKGMKDNVLRHANIIEDEDEKRLILSDIVLDHSDRIPSFEDLLDIRGKEWNRRTNLFFKIKKDKPGSIRVLVDQLLTTETVLSYDPYDE